MRIVHVCLEQPYIDGWLYQENALPRHHASMGHEVTVVGSRNRLPGYLRGKIDYRDRVEPYWDGPVQVVRIKSSVSLLTHLNHYRSLRPLFQRLQPDLIFHHGGQSLSLLESKYYVESHRHARLFVDFHSEIYNSARGWGSRNLLHRQVWRRLIQHCLPSISRIYCISQSTRSFCEQLYDLPADRMELLFLGVEPIKASAEERETVRRSVRDELGLSSADFLLITGGKLNPDKQIPLLLRALEKLDRGMVHLLVFGTADASHQAALEAHLKVAPRVHYVGWCDSGAINRYFIASDLAVFPGGQSVLWQQSIATGLPGIYRKWAGHEHLDRGNCRYLFSESPEELAQWLGELTDPRNARIVGEMRDRTIALANGEMSYRLEAERIIADYQAMTYSPHSVALPGVPE